MKRRIIAAAATILAVTGCGKEDDGYVYKTNPVELKAEKGSPGDLDLTEASYLSLTWIHQCPENPMIVPADSPGRKVIEGPGPHKVIRERLLGTDIIFKGRICKPRQYARDVVIGVDISSSAYWNDKPVANSCRRLDAVNKILDSLPSDAKMGLFTFEEEILETTTGLVANKSTLEGQIAATGTTMFSVICGPRGGASDFNVAMRKARDLLKTGRANGSKKELYLVTDGVGTSIFPTAEAETIATEISSTGIVIGTEKIPASISGAKIAYSGPTTAANVLDKVVTKDGANQKLLQPVDQAIKLANEVAKFAVNNWTEAKLAHNTDGGTNVVVHDLKPLMNGDFEFTIPTFKFDLDLVQTGHIVKINIKDTHGTVRTQEVKFVWED